jgi:hypothetical protein
MTVAAGFPIASLIPGTQKAQNQSGLLKSSTSKAPTASELTSFRAGLEALVSKGLTNSDVELSEATKATKDEPTEDSATVQSNGKRDLFSETAIQIQSSPLPPAGQTPKPSTSQPPFKSDLPTAAKWQAAAQPESDSWMPSAQNAPKTVAANSSKSADTERSAPSKPSHDNVKADAQTSTASDQGLVLAPVHLTDPNLTPMPAPQHAQSAHTSSGSNSATSTTASSSSSGLSASIGTESELQGKILSVAPPLEDATPTSAAISATKAQSSHAATATESATQSTLQRPDAPTPSSPDDLSLQSQIKTAYEQSTSTDTATAAQGADAMQSRSAPNRDAAARERSPLQHQTAGDTAQQVVAVGTHAALTRDPVAMSGASNDRGSATTGFVQSQPGTSSSPTARDTFAALDADPGQLATAWTHTSPRQVEAGYQDPSLGWVSVRADMTSGGLHASVIPTSQDAAQALGSHLSGLNAYLSEHHGGSVTASLAAPEDRSLTQQSGTGSGTQSGARQQNESSQSAVEELSGQASSSAPHTGIQQAELASFTPTHTGRISVLA